MAGRKNKSVEGYCSVCRIDRMHRVLDELNDRPLMVKCESCGSEGAPMSPRSKVKAALLKAVERKREDRDRSALLDRLAKLRSKGKLTADVWRELTEGRDTRKVTRYRKSAALEELQLVQHRNFGLGIVVERVEGRKAYVLFEDRERLMVCGG